jgi:hypothetical protein
LADKPEKETQLPDQFHRATNRYLAWLGIACLITFPELGVGAIVIWGLTALMLWGLWPKAKPPSARPPQTRSRRPKKTCRRTH